MIGPLVRRLGRLGVRLWTPFLLLALGLLIVGVLVLYVIYGGQRQYVTNLQEEAAARASLRVSDYVQTVENTLVAYAQMLSSVGSDPAMQRRYLESLLDANPAFFELAIADTTGQETAKVVQDERVGNQALLSLADTDKFLTASQGYAYSGPVYISEFGVPFYSLAVPISDEEGNIVGILAAEVNFDEMWSILNRIPVGQAGYIYLVDGKGNLIAHHNLEKVMRQPRASQQVVGVQRFLAGDFQVTEYLGLEGEPVIGARQRIPGTDWGIVTELPVGEAFRFANLLALTAVLGFVVVVVAVLAMGGFITHRVVRPLIVLSEGAAVLGRGNLDHRIEVAASDEIEELAAEFNAMASSLQQAQAETQTRLREVLSLVEAGRAITSLDLQRVLDTLAKEAARAVAAQMCVIYMLDETSLTLEPAYIWSQPGVECSPPRRSVGEGVAGWVAEHVQSLRIEDIHTEPRFATQEAGYVNRSMLGLPLLVSGRSVGVLLAADKSESARGFTPDDERLLQAFADQAAVAIENARLFAATERNMREVSILYETTSALSSKLSVDELLSDLAQRMALALEADQCTIATWDKASDTLLVVAWTELTDGTAGAASEANRIRSSFIRERTYLVSDFPAIAGVLHTQRPASVVVSDPQASRAEVERLRKSGWRSLLMLPLVMRDTVVGLVEIYDAQERIFTGEEMRLAQALTIQAAIALHNAQLFSLTDEQLHRRIEELSGLQRVSQELNSTLDQDRILQLVLKEAVRATGADFGNVNLHDKDTGQLLANASFGLDEEERRQLKASEFHAGTGVIGRVLQTAEPILVPDVSEEPDYVMISSRARSEVAVPILVAGDVAGIINLESQQLNNFSEEQLQYLQALANQAAVAIRNAWAYEEQRQQRELTRQRAEQLARLSEVSRAFRSDQPLASVLEDIAYAINETLGFDIVLISLVQDEPPMLHHVAGAGIPILEMQQLKNTSQFPDVVTDMMQDRFQLGVQSYYIPHTYREIWEGRFDMYRGQPENPSESDELLWHVDDLCYSPLYNSEQRLIGVIWVTNPRDGQVPTRQTMETLELFANQAAATVENARLFQSEQERRQLADTLREVAAVVTSTLSVDQVIGGILDQLRNVVPYDSATVQVLTGDQLTITGGRGWDEIEDVLGLTFPIEGDNPNSVVVQTRAPYVVPDTQAAYATFRQPPHNHIHSWLGIPLLFGDNLLGMIALDSVDPDHYTQEHAQLALTFANQVAIALQNAQLFEQARQYANQLRVINEVGVEFTSILNVDELTARVSQLVEENFGHYVTIALIKDEYLVWHSAHIPKNGRIWQGGRIGSPPRIGDRGITGWAVESGKTVIAPDLSKDPRFVPDPKHEEKPNGRPFRSEVAVPLKVHDKIIGVFGVQSDKPQAFDQNELLVLQALANQVAVAISNAQLFEQLRQLGQELEQRVEERTEALAKTLEDLTLERDRVEALYRITSELSASLDLDRVLAEALSLINRAVGVSHGSILLMNTNQGNLVYRAALGRAKGLPRGGITTRFSRGVGLAGWVIETHEAVIVPDVTRDPRWIPSEKKSTPERRSAMAVPLSSGDDVLGVLLLFHPEVDYFTPDHLKLVSAAATQVATAINNAELYQLITDQAERLGVMLRTQRAEAAKLQAIVEGIADGVLVLDANYQVVLINSAAARILGLDAREVEQQHLSQILGRAEATVDQALALQLYDNLATGIEHFSLWENPEKGKAPVSRDFRLEADGKVIVGSLSPVSLTSDELPSLVTVLRDISREAEVERLKNEFISTVSHELRTPMTSIKGYTDLLVSERVGVLSEQQRHFVQVIKNNADRLTALVNDILDISRIETGRIRLQIERLDLAALINGVVDTFRGRMVEKSLDLTLDLPPVLPPVLGDESRVVQILENLTSNAWKYTPEEGQVTIRARVSDGYIQVDVTDTGIGMDSKDLPQIFDRFYRTEQAEVQAVDGSGLGLSIVKMFVELLGGRIWVESELDHGSTFSFTLPVAIETRLEPSDAGMLGPKVLVVDDDEHIMQLLCHHLQRDGYQVVTAQRGEDVFHLAKSEQPALITLDILLADMNGFEVLKQLKEDPGTSDIPVIIISVVPDADTRGLALGAVGHIGKPFEEHQVLSQIQEVLSSLSPGDQAPLNHVLVVDDDHHIVSWLKQALTDNGYVVQGAYNGHEALALAREDSPDLILLDLKMPDMDGYEVIRNLRREHMTRNIPVIVITGTPLDDDYDHVKILGMGVEQMLTKPFTVESLVEEIKRVESGTGNQV